MICEVSFQSLIGRLQTLSGREYKNEKKLFQSLIGRLQTIFNRRYVVLYVMFQSLIGRLQTLSALPMRAGITGFNPS